jgi:hypothetical protein
MDALTLPNDPLQAAMAYDTCRSLAGRVARRFYVKKWVLPVAGKAWESQDWAIFEKEVEGPTRLVDTAIGGSVA